jgi:hypothetical protein
LEIEKDEDEVLDFIIHLETSEKFINSVRRQQYIYLYIAILFYMMVSIDLALQGFSRTTKNSDLMSYTLVDSFESIGNLFLMIQFIKNKWFKELIFIANWQMFYILLLI